MTVVYSEPVSTVISDYANLTGATGNAGLVSVDGSGTATITLGFSGTAFAPGQSGYMTIGTNVYGINDSTYFGGGTFQVTDTCGPDTHFRLRIFQ